MNRVFPVIQGLALASVLALAGCASKSADTDGAAGASSSSSGTSGGSSSSASDTTVGGDSSFDLSSLPVVYFEFDQATIRSSDREKLKLAAEALRKEKSAQVTIEGHCDERGSIEYNLALGDRRARAVKSYLTQLGVSSGQLKALSYGEERPADTTSSESAWSKNRRAELVLNR